MCRKTNFKLNNSSKMKLLNRLLLAFLAIGIISCSNDEPSIESSSALQSKTGEEPEIETFDIKVSYRAKCM